MSYTPIANPLDYAFNRDPMLLYHFEGGGKVAYVWACHTEGDADDAFREWAGIEPEETDEDGTPIDGWATEWTGVNDPDIIAAVRQRCLDYINDIGPDPRKEES